MRTAPVLALACCMTSAVWAAAAASRPDDPLSVGGALARRGQLTVGVIDVPAGLDPGERPTQIPVTVAHGAAPGAVLALIAGTHGYEYTSVLALQRVVQRLDPARMNGSVILVHMANPPTFYGRRIYYGPDGKNLNRMYPGRPDGSISERIAWAITTEVIDKATHLADMHCGDGNESLRPYSYWMVGGDPKVDEASLQMVLAYGLDHIVIDRQRPADPRHSVYTATTAIVRGKPAITTESGGMGLTDEASVAAHEAGAMSLLSHLGIMEAPSVKVQHPIWIDRAEVLRAPVEGIWRHTVEKMQTVAQGTLIGVITDPYGRILAEIRAPFAGEVLYVVATPPVARDEPVAFIGQPAASAPAP